MEESRMRKKQWYGDKKNVYIYPRSHEWFKSQGKKGESFADVIDRHIELLKSKGIGKK